MNTPILYDNAIEQYDHPLVQDGWLWFADTHSKCPLRYDADRYAREVEMLVRFLDKILPISCKPFKDNWDMTKQFDLIKFFIKRHANSYIGDNTKLWWE